RHTSFSRDWSSDVCSSDLGQDPIVRFGGTGELQPKAMTHGAMRAVATDEPGHSEILFATIGVTQRAGHAVGLLREAHEFHWALEIGRASCRERDEMPRADA